MQAEVGTIKTFVWFFIVSMGRLETVSTCSVEDNSQILFVCILQFKNTFDVISQCGLICWFKIVPVAVFLKITVQKHMFHQRRNTCRTKWRLARPNTYSYIDIKN